MIAELEAVKLLTEQKSMRIDLGGHGYTVKQPCLLAQLQDAIAQGMERGGGGGGIGPGAGVPISTEALDLWEKINYNTHALAQHLGLNRRDPAPSSPTPWVGRLMRHAVATAHGKGLYRLTERVAHNARSWAAQIEAMLSKAPRAQRGIRGQACADCGQIWVHTPRHDGTYKQPAIVMIIEDEGRWLVCLGCGSTDPVDLPAGLVIYQSESENDDH